MAWIATDNFDTYTPGASLAGDSGGSGWNGNWALAGGAGTVTTENAPSGMSGVVAKYVNGAGKEASRAITAPTGICVMSFQVQCAQANKVERIRLANAGVSERITVTFTATGTIEANGTSIQSYVANQTYLIKLIWGHIGTDFQISIDGGAYSSPIAISGGSTTITTFAFNDDGSGGSTFYIDAIQGLSNVFPRYWVGGTGNWDSSTITHWSITTGGTAGAPVPTSSDDVFFDASSGAGTVTITATANTANLDFTGYTQTLAGSSALNIYGNLTLVSGMTLSYTGAITFASTATGKTITTGLLGIGSAVTFNGVGGGWTLQDNFISTAAITVTNGTVNLNGKTTTGTTLSNAGTVTTSNAAVNGTTFTNTGTVTMGSSLFTLSGAGTVWSGAGTVTAGTSTIKLTNASSSAKTFAGAGLTYNNLWITGSGTGAYTITGSNTFNDFKADTPPHTINFTAGTTTTVSSFTVNGTAGNLMTLQSTSAGTQWILACHNLVSCDYLSLQDSRAVSI